ncbi:cathepsin B-like [Patiria miniata]|uniref:Peptidase C1A papain C-terminal domain-containing protein n=1 Tax=Patiria miniata TaxID=46514 RepID=A0A913ZL30_PATMI|nr:cathepsin B-like [Patiria miniata]
MKYLLICAFGLVTVASALPLTSLQQDFVEYSADLINRINAMNTSWKAGPNFAGETVGSVLSRFGPVGAEFSPAEEKPVLPVTDDDTDIPTEFDARTKWPQCPSIGRITDQGRCNAYWAFAAVEVINDRYCISQGVHVNISVEDALTCNPYIVPNRGCQAASSPYLVLKTWAENGLVTGGAYDSNAGCRPYPYKPCTHYENGTYSPCQRPPEFTFCNKSCRAGYPNDYEQDKHYGSYYSVAQSEASIQREIMTNGSVTSYIVYYQDFPLYRSGVYRHTSDLLVGSYSLKILGWGVEGDQKYWLCASSWNTECGDKGFIKVLRGVNECRIEESVKAGTPVKP